MVHGLTVVPSHTGDLVLHGQHLASEQVAGPSQAYEGDPCRMSTRQRPRRHFQQLDVAVASACHPIGTGMALHDECMRDADDPFKTWVLQCWA